MQAADEKLIINELGPNAESRFCHIEMITRLYSEHRDTATPCQLAVFLHCTWSSTMVALNPGRVGTRLLPWWTYVRCSAFVVESSLSSNQPAKYTVTWYRWWVDSVPAQSGWISRYWTDYQQGFGRSIEVESFGWGIRQDTLSDI